MAEIDARYTYPPGPPFPDATASIVGQRLANPVVMLFAALLYRPRVLACQMRLRLLVLCLVCSCATRFGAVGFATAWDGAVGNDCVDVSDRNVTLHDVYPALWFHIADDCVSNSRLLAQVLEWP